jgi:hypothetical protein
LGVVLCDTSMRENIETTIDMMPYIVKGQDDYEPDDSFEEAHPIQSGEYQARRLSDEGDVDYIIFYAMSGRNYIIETDIPEWYSTDTTLTIYDPGRTQIAYDEDGGINGGSKILWYAPYTGVCYIKVDKSHSYSYGSYGLSLYWQYSGNAVQYGLEKLREWSH